MMMMMMIVPIKNVQMIVVTLALRTQMRSKISFLASCDLLFPY